MQTLRKAMRRHPRKGKRWLMRRYFARRGGRSWCFFGSRRKPDRTREVVWLFHATSLPFSVYTKVKRASNPYHPAWEMYFEKRESRHMAHTLAGRAVLLYLWRTQGGKCPACGLPISWETGWHSHHVVPKGPRRPRRRNQPPASAPGVPSSTAQPIRLPPPLRLAGGVWKA